MVWELFSQVCLLVCPSELNGELLYLRWMRNMLIGICIGILQLLLRGVSTNRHFILEMV
jgi:hypothetical protein